MKPASLSSRHYAANWTTDTHYRVQDINALGCEYARLPDDSELKKEKLLEIARCFHGYLLKYLTMICLGHVPQWNGRVNKDVEPFLRFFVTKGQEPNSVNLLHAARRLHLGFRSMLTDEVYDVLMEQMLAAIRRYDPNYTDKVKLITEIIDEELRKHSTFTPVDITSHLDFDADGYLRLLARRGFLVATAKAGPEGVRYARSGTWPPPDSFFKSGPIGLVYYIQTWFRYYLQQWIEDRMRQIESKDGIYSLETGYEIARAMSIADVGGSSLEKKTPHAYGEFTDASGRSWSADITLSKTPMDAPSSTSSG
jgi:hypothetical protein